MKNLVFLLFITVLFTSCSEYQKALNKGTIADQYKMAEELYEAGKYSKAITLFEKVTPAFKGKPQMQRIQFMVANSNFKTKSYELAAYYFNRFINNYPKSSKLEEANFLVSQSYYKSSPVFSLDQKDSQKALTSLQVFLDRYPDSNNAKLVNSQYKELTEKLEKKAFEIAKQYYKTENYIAAITALGNFTTEYLGSKYKEDALFYKFKAGYDLSLKSIFHKKEKRLNDALKYHKRFIKYYPESQYIEESDAMLERINITLENMELLNSK
ncbi:MAG: outer membrane protein assembly factor BamD [Flavobacteriaceae bacterium]|nr:outer membrane protein assembly factor BamD [Flavobacteriaceae bacterium]